MSGLLEGLHFARPLWLWGLLLLPLLTLLAVQRRRRRRAWQAAVDSHLLPHLLQPGRGAGAGACPQAGAQRTQDTMSDAPAFEDGAAGGDKGGDDDQPQGPRRGDQMPEIEELVRKGQDRLRVLMGGKPSGGGGNRPGGPRGPIFCSRPANCCAPAPGCAWWRMRTAFWTEALTYIF